MKRVALVFAAFSLMALTPASASAEWTKDQSFEYAGKTSLKIVEPEGAKVFVTVGGETKEDALPAIISLPDTDAFVAVKVVATDGDVWNGKVEVKAHKQTVLKLAHKAAAAAPAAAGPVHKHIGEMQNLTHKCTRREQGTLRFVAMKDGVQTFETTVAPNRRQANIELAAGHYTIRIFQDGRFITAKELDVTKDGWLFKWGCD